MNSTGSQLLARWALCAVLTLSLVHLAGCGSTGPPNEPYNCHMSSPCNGGFERVLYGWGKNAPAMTLPDGVGYSVGPGSAIQSLVLQVGAS